MSHPRRLQEERLLPGSGLRGGRGLHEEGLRLRRPFLWRRFLRGLWRDLLWGWRWRRRLGRQVLDLREQRVHVWSVERGRPGRRRLRLLARLGGFSLRGIG